MCGVHMQSIFSHAMSYTFCLTKVIVADGTLLLTIVTDIVAVVDIDGVRWVYSITRLKH